MSRRDVTGAVDVAVLEIFTQGDDVLTDEVLGLFQEQARLWAPMLDTRTEGWKDAAHTLKGSAAGVGAKALADACEAVETADRDALFGRLEAVKDALDAALSDVAAWRHELMLKGLKS